MRLGRKLAGGGECCRHRPRVARAMHMMARLLCRPWLSSGMRGGLAAAASATSLPPHRPPQCSADRGTNSPCALPPPYPRSYDFARTARMAFFNAGMGVLGHEVGRGRGQGRRCAPRQGGVANRRKRWRQERPRRGQVGSAPGERLAMPVRSWVPAGHKVGVIVRIVLSSFRLACSTTKCSTG